MLQEIYTHPSASPLRRRIAWACFLLSMPFLASPSFAQEATGRTKRIYTVGNSLTMTIHIDKLIGVAKTRGNTLEWERSGIAGASLDYLWENRKKEATATLDKGNWDILSLQPFLRALQQDLPVSETIITTALKENPNIVTFVYAQYIHDNGFDYQDVWLQDVSEYLKTGKGEGAFWPNRCRQYYEAMTLQLREKMPKQKIYMAPVGHAFALLDEKINARLVPGVDSIFQLWGDATHANSLGGYLSAMVYYAMIFQESPVGLPIGEYQGKEGEWHITDDQARILQETAWEVVATTPLSGVKAPGLAPKIATPSLYRKAVTGEHYRKELTAVFGVQPYKWNLSGGELPKGVTLDEAGFLNGVPTETGEFNLEFTLTDARSASDKRSLILTVEEDAKPRLLTTEADLGSYRAGETIAIHFKADGGNGKLKWRADTPQGFRKALDFGLQMRADGLLSGSVGKPGVYSFKARVKDGDIASPEVIEQTYQITITDPGPDVLKVKTIPNGTIVSQWTFRDRDPKGYADAYFKQFERYKWQPLARTVEGTSDNKAEFLVLSESSGIHVLVKVYDADLVMDKKNLSDGDSVEIYLDTLNNREKIYNADDRRLILAPDGTTAGSKDVRYGFVRKYADGYYIASIYLNQFTFGRATDPYVVMGLDIAVNDRDSADGKVSRIMWHGDRLHEVDTSTFGTIIFMPEGE